MTIILFVVDNSISMSQKTSMGWSLLDVAKKAVETFLKFRARDANHRLDRIMLMTFDEFPTHLKVGWRETLLVFQNELKNMQATASSSGSGGADILSLAFELLNVNRLQSGIDTYGQGRNPFYVESSILIFLTDGHCFFRKTEMSVAVNTRIAGMELTREPYRWDQRLFTVLLKMPGIPSAAADNVNLDPPRDTSVLEGFSSMTGGRSFVVDSVKTVDVVMQKITESMQNGVMVRLEPLLDSSTLTTLQAAPSSLTRMIYLPKNPQKTHINAHWPLPEPFWLDLSPRPLLPPRNAHPVLKYRPCMDDLPVMPTIGEVPFPVDRYDVAPSPLTQEIIDKMPRFSHWQVFVEAEGSGDQPLVQQLCGYLTAHQNGADKTMVLNVLPCNYPRLLDLLDRLNRNHNKKEWKGWFDEYIHSIPAYYAAALRRYLVKSNMHLLISDAYDMCLSRDLQEYLRKVKLQSKSIFDNTQAFYNQPFPAPDLIPVLQKSSSKLSLLTGVSSSAASEVASGGKDVDVESGAFDHLLAKSVAEQLEADAAAFKIHLRPPSILFQRNHIVLHRNPFDVERDDLVSQLRSLKFSLLFPEKWKSCEEPDRSVPVGQMGNYQDYLKTAVAPLRDIDESNKLVAPMFGNPWIKKKTKTGAVGASSIVDEADVDALGLTEDNNNSNNAARPPKPRSTSEPRTSNNNTSQKSTVPLPSSGSGSNKRSRSTSPSSSTSSPRSPVKHHPPRMTLEQQLAAPISPSNPHPISPTVKRRLNAVVDQHLPSSVAVKMMKKEDNTIISPNGVVGGVLVDKKPVTNGVVIDDKKVDTVKQEEEVGELVLDANVMQRFRMRALRTIKTPGRNFTPILDMINEVNGAGAGRARTLLVEQIIIEATRFRRQSLINLLKETYLTTKP